MNHKKKKNFGFTLIELLVYLSLVTGILITATTFAWNIIGSRTKAFAVEEVEQNGRLIMERLTRDLHQAVKANEPQPGLGSDKLSLAMRDKAADPIVYYVKEGQLFISQADSQPQALSSKEVVISKLIFTNLSSANAKSRNIKISFVISHLNPSNRVEWSFTDTFTTAVELRD